MINLSELRKIYIAELGFDPHLQMALRSRHKVKKAQKTIDQIKNTIQDPFEAEAHLMGIIKQLAASPRQREYAGMLMQMGFNANILTGKSYEYARENYFGVKDWDDATRERVESMKMREFKTDPFSMIEGTQPMREINYQ